MRVSMREPRPCSRWESGCIVIGRLPAGPTIQRFAPPGTPLGVYRGGMPISCGMDTAPSRKRPQARVPTEPTIPKPRSSSSSVQSGVDLGRRFVIRSQLASCMLPAHTGLSPLLPRAACTLISSGARTNRHAPCWDLSCSEITRQLRPLHLTGPWSPLPHRRIQGHGTPSLFPQSSLTLISPSVCSERVRQRTQTESFDSARRPLTPAEPSTSRITLSFPSRPSVSRDSFRRRCPSLSLSGAPLASEAGVSWLRYTS